MTLPLVLPFEGTAPALEGPPRAAPGSAILGRVRAGTGLVLGPHATVRADGEVVTLGRDVFLGARATVHIATDFAPTFVEDGVSAGPDTIIHGCTIGAGCVLGAGAVVLDKAVIGPGALLEPGTIVYPRRELPGGRRYGGTPARDLGPVDRAELAAAHGALRAAAHPDPAPAAPHSLADAGAFLVADTARLSGRIAMAEGSSIWFACDFEGGEAGITLGRDVNIQDNSRLVARDRPLTIGPGSSFGHNVIATDVQVGTGSLVGMGCVLAPGTIIGDGILLAAGARTEPGQHLDAPGLWGGAPARRMGDLDEMKRAMITGTTHHYRLYALAFAASQRAASAG